MIRSSKPFQVTPSPPSYTSPRGSNAGNKKEEDDFGDSLRAVNVKYLQETSIHGLKYVGEPNRHLVERVFW